MSKKTTNNAKKLITNKFTIQLKQRKLAIANEKTFATIKTIIFENNVFVALYRNKINSITTFMQTSQNSIAPNNIDFIIIIFKLSNIFKIEKIAYIKLNIITRRYYLIYLSYSFVDESI